MTDERAEIRFADVRYVYPGNDAFALDIPRFAFAAGECAAVRGVNGSGKTTLGRLAAGLLRPPRGSVLIGGEDITDWPLGKIGGKVGYLFQEPSRQIFAPTVEEEITFPLMLKGMDRRQAQEIALSALARFEMEKLAGASMFRLSRGEKQRLALAAIMVNEPRFLVLDEPTTGLDPRRKGLLGRILSELVGKGAGVLLISHDAAFVREYADVEHRISEGRLVEA